MPASNKPWRLTALAAAMGALLSVAHFDANALALGRITSLSSLGEPLVAGIDVPDINDEERASLKASLASPDAFRIAGMEYNPALESAQVTLVRRDNGSSYLLVRSEKVVTDPFVNLVINANWSTGRIVRNYTLLLDPPAAKQSEAAAVAAPIAVLPAPSVQAVSPTPSPTPAQVTPQSTPPAASAPAAVVAAAGAATPTRAQAPATPSPAPTAVAMPKAPVATKPSMAAQKAPSSNSGEQVKVSNGDTAGKIAANNLSGNVSLEQMLVAMLRGNPQAFIGNNINRLKAGAILDLPTEAEAAAISASEAKQSVVAQSKDFSSFRRKLAENAPTLASKSTDRVASGKIEAKVEDQKAAAVTPDKLTLSKGGLTAGDKSAAAAKENLEKIAKERQAKDDAARSAELAKNIKDLNKIASATPTAPAAASVAAKTATPAATVAVPAAPAVAAVVASPAEKAATPPVATPAAAVAAAPAVPTTPAAPAVAPKPPVVAKAPVVVATVAEPSALDFLMDDPVVLPAAGGLLIALLAGGLYANSKRKKRNAAEQAEDDALSDEHFEEKSFFNETTNEPIMEREEPAVEISDAAPAAEELAPVITNEITHEANEIAVPTVNAHAVVDPLTEANVYLDYGRDVQAEEILKDGLKTQPENVAIYAKLMGIYAKRRDAKNFEQMALKAKLLMTESDPQWLALSKEGFELEPSNPLYQAGAPDADDPLAAISGTEFSTRTVAQIDPESAKSPASVDLDLDFNFASAFPESTKKVEPPKSPLVDFPDFSLEPVKAAVAPTASAISAPVVATAAAITAAVVTAPQTATASTNMPKPLELDLGHLSLDLNNTTAKVNTLMPTSGEDNNAPLETKLALAQEFRAIGDATGAKMLASEVLASATGSLKTRAETFLAEIG
jgi:pilus assembly protein FimV